MLCVRRFIDTDLIFVKANASRSKQSGYEDKIRTGKRDQIRQAEDRKMIYRPSSPGNRRLKDGWRGNAVCREFQFLSDNIIPNLAMLLLPTRAAPRINGMRGEIRVLGRDRDMIDECH